MVDSVHPTPSPGVLARSRNAWALPPGSVRIALLVFAGYYLGARLGLALTFLPLPISVLWPPNAILLGALVLLPTSAWWIVLAAAFPAHLLAELHDGIPLVMVLSWYASNLAEALVGASLVRAALKGAAPFATLRGMVIFIISAYSAAILSSFLDSALVILNQWGDVPYWDLLRRRALSNMASALVVASVVIAWGAADRTPLPKAHRARVLEAGALAAGLALVAGLAFNTDSAWFAPCAPIPFLLWAAMRFGMRCTSAAFAAVAFAAIWGAGHGMGVLATAASPLDVTRTVQLFLLCVGTVLFCFAAAADQHRRAQASLAELRFRLVQASRLAALGEMAGSIAHEISQPMSAILTNVEAAQAMLAAGRLGDAQLRGILADVRDDDLRAVQIVHHIRDLARQREPQLCDFDLVAQVNAVISLTRPLARHRGMAIDARCEGALVVHGDPINVQHALANFIANAMDAMADTPEEQRRVQVDVAALPDAAVVSVRDWGHGIPADALEKVFEPFFTTKKDGMGLGLSISRSLVTAQGGRIWAQNNPDRGATVCFTVPHARMPGVPV